MPSRDPARASVANFELLSGKLDRLMSDWERAIANGGTGTPTGSRTADVQEQLAAVEKECAEMRSEAETELKVAADWAAKGVMARRAGRDDLDAQAMRRAEEHRAAGVTLQVEVDALDKALDQLRRLAAQQRENIKGAVMPPHTR